MQNQIYPCLWFDGKAKEAANFYCDVFEQSRIIHSTPIVTIFEIEDSRFMALNGGPIFSPGPSISFFVHCTSLENIESKWKKLCKGGKVMMELDKYPWSEKYGWCEDKYGVSWQLIMGEEIEQKIIPSLMFTQENNGKAEEALQFYTSVFPNSEIVALSRYAQDEHDVEGNIKYGQFTLNGKSFSAMESSGMHQFNFTEGNSLVISCKNQEEIDHYWNSLTADGGTESRCGWLKDKYGLSWQVVPENMGELMSDPDKAKRVTEAYMKMKKLDIEALENA